MGSTELLLGEAPQCVLEKGRIWACAGLLLRLCLCPCAPLMVCSMPLRSAEVPCFGTPPSTERSSACRMLPWGDAAGPGRLWRSGAGLLWHIREGAGAPVPGERALATSAPRAAILQPTKPVPSALAPTQPILGQARAALEPRYGGATNPHTPSSYPLHFLRHALCASCAMPLFASCTTPL